MTRLRLVRARAPAVRAATLAALLLPVAAAGPARAEKAAPIPASITVSGGVSLGAYEAGFLYYTLATVHREPRIELKLLTGASAGGLNALLSVLEACGTGSPTPADSLFWKLWIPVGFDRLYVPEATTQLSVFSQEWLEQGAARIEQAWNGGIDARCDVVLGISATRLKPRTLETAGGALQLPRMEEKLAIRIQGRGPGVPPRATNYVDGSTPPEEVILVTDARGEIAFSELRDLLIASMSFPVAFPPASVRTCTSGSTAAAGVCLPAEAERALYVDGGVFDNAPLRYAVQLAADGLRAADDPGVEWREAPMRGADAIPPDLAFMALDPDATEYPERPERDPKRAPETASIVSLVGALGAGFLDTARSKELLTLVEEHPEIAQRVLLPRRHFPAASAPLAAFLGFFETEFRAFDFHLGMYDARRMLDRQMQERAGAPLRTPEPDGVPAGGGLGGWAPLACLRAVYDGVGSAADACGSDDLADFRALLQLSLDGLYAACSEAESDDGPFPWRSAHCRRAAAGAPPPVVPGVAALEARGADGWRRGEEEREVEYTLRLLGSYGFRFRDLGVPAGRGELALRRIRAKLGAAARDLAEAQPEGQQLAVGRAAKLAADLVAYSPQRTVLHLTTGPTETELGASFRGPGWLPGNLRLSGAVALRGLGEILSAGRSDPFAVLAVAGIEAQPLVGNPILSQLRVGLRGGWLSAADDEWGAGSCVDRGADHVASCSRAVMQGVVSITALEQFRLQLVAEWFPGSAHRESAWSFAPGLGLELGF